MDLLAIRKEVVKISGRYDLVNDPTTCAVDNGIDHYIYEGQKALERRLSTPPTQAKLYKDLTVGDYIVKFKNCRAVYEVWVFDSTSGTKLEKIRKHDLKALVAKSAVSAATRGKPYYYLPIDLRRTPDDETGATDSTMLTSYLDVESPSDPEYKAVMLYPPADQAYGIEVFGLFYNLELSSNTDENYWSVNYPNLLIMAALHQLSYMYKGGKTVSAWSQAIEEELVNIDKDAIEQEIYDIKVKEESL